MKRLLIAMIAMFLLIGVGCSDNAVQQDVSTDQSAKDDSSNQTESPDEGDSDTGKNDVPAQATEDKENHQEHNNPPVTDDLRVHYIDVGQADATLFQYEHESTPYTILFDAGDWNKKDVVSYLHAQDVSTIDLIIISHPHADHIGQLPQIMEEFDVDEVWFSGNTASSNTYQQAAEAVLESDADYYEPHAGESFQVGSLTIEVLHPSELTGGLNEDSISVRMEYGGVAFLFTGDAYKQAEKQMMQQTDHMQAQFLQLGHHGSNTSTDKQFIQEVQPEVAIYSAGTGNSYGHPHQETLDTLTAEKVDIYGTDVHGTIIVTTDGETYEVSTSSKGTVQAGSTSTKDASTKKDKTPKKESKKSHEQSSNGTCVDINKASIHELERIKHIGPARAEELIDLRPFDSIDDLSRISGIGPARIADIKEEGIACIGGE
ncbi:MAG TPA: MBL fold metallo-hydrolase [Bacillota bacterium]|nr:MBL fold metallo-hydrolase [Bacillota bacterium]